MLVDRHVYINLYVYIYIGAVLPGGGGGTEVAMLWMYVYVCRYMHLDMFHACSVTAVLADRDVYIDLRVYIYIGAVLPRGGAEVAMDMYVCMYMYVDMFHEHEAE